MELNDRTIEKSIVVKAPRSVVWQMWTTEKGLCSFFPPQCHVEFKIGGAYEMYFLVDAEDGSRGSEGCKILSYLPERMLSFSWNAPPTIPTVRDHEHKAWVVIDLREHEEGTEVLLYHLGFLEGDDWEKCIDYFEEAWGRVLNRLKESFTNA